MKIIDNEFDLRFAVLTSGATGMDDVAAKDNDENLNRVACMIEATGYGRTDNWVSRDCRFVLAPAGYSNRKLGDIPVLPPSSSEFSKQLKEICAAGLEHNLGSFVRRPLRDDERHDIVKFSVGYYGQMKQERPDHPVSISRKLEPSIFMPQYLDLAPSSELLSYYNDAKKHYHEMKEHEQKEETERMDLFEDNSPILLFRGENSFLSNMYELAADESPIVVDGIGYWSSEAAFQAQKTLDNTERLKISRMKGPDARRAGRTLTLRKDWESRNPDGSVVKVEAMRKVLAAKFKEGTSMAEKLLATKNRYISERGRWADTFWGGGDNGEGGNVLGNLLMQQRDKLVLARSPEVYIAGVLKEYEKRYRRQLALMDPKTIMEDLERIGKGEDFTLMCYEKDEDGDVDIIVQREDPTETFCHRFIAQDWLANAMLSNALGRECALLDLTKDATQTNHRSSKSNELKTR